MARHAQPLALAELKGSVRDNPKRYGKVVPENPNGIGEPPEHMGLYAQAIWHELVASALPGVLTGSERFMLEIACNLLSEYRENPIEFKVGKYPHLVGILARLGLSPADRQKLGVGKEEKDDNQFDMFDMPFN